MYNTNEVTLEELTREGLFKTESSNGVSPNLEEKDEFSRENDGTVKFNGQDLEISVKINGANYICSKTECSKSS